MFYFYQSHCTRLPFKVHHIQECHRHSAISTSSGVVSVSRSPLTFLILIMRSTVLLFKTMKNSGPTYHERRAQYLFPGSHGNLVKECEQVKVTAECIYNIIWFLSSVTILCMSWLKWQEMDLSNGNEGRREKAVKVHFWFLWWIATKI